MGIYQLGIYAKRLLTRTDIMDFEVLERMIAWNDEWNASMRGTIHMIYQQVGYNFVIGLRHICQP